MMTPNEYAALRRELVPGLGVLFVLPVLQEIGGDVAPWLNCFVSHLRDECCGDRARLDAELLGILIVTLVALSLLFVGAVRDSVSSRVLIFGVAVALANGVFSVATAAFDEKLGFPALQKVAVALYFALALAVLYGLPALLARRAPRRLLHVYLASVVTLGVGLVAGLALQGVLDGIWSVLANADHGSRKFLLAPMAIVPALVTWAAITRHPVLYPELWGGDDGRRRWQRWFGLAGLTLVVLHAALHLADDGHALTRTSLPIVVVGMLLCSLLLPMLSQACHSAGAVWSRSAAHAGAALGLTVCLVALVSFFLAGQILGDLEIARAGEDASRFGEDDIFPFVVSHAVVAAMLSPTLALSRRVVSRAVTTVFGPGASDPPSSDRK